MIYNKIFVMKKLLTIISVIGAAILAVSGCSKTDVSVEAGGEGGDEGEQTVEIVPAEGSVNLDEFSDYIVSVEDDAIWFHPTEEGAGSVSKAQTKVMLPALLVPGAIVYALTPSERFPHGFLGRVVEVTEEEGLVKAITERTTISESFDMFRVSGSFEMEMESDEGSSGLSAYSEGGYMYVSGHIENSFGETGKAEYSISGDVTTGLRVHLDINQGLKVKEPYFKAEMNLKYETAFSFGCNVSGYHDFDIKAITLAGRFLHPALIVLEPVLKFQPVVTVEGKAGFTTGVKISRHILVSIENVNDTWLHDIRDVDGRNAPKTDFEGVDFNISGKAYVGMMLGPGLRLCGMDSQSITLRPSLGIEVGGEFNMDITGGNFYNTFKDTKISLALQGRADVLVRTGGKTISPLGVAKLNLWETEKYIFPEFECTQLVQSDDEVTAGYNATRDVLLPTSVATGVWTQDGSAKVSESEARPYAFIEDTGFDFAGTHTGLKPGKYNVRPIVKLGPYDIPAFPETEFEIESVKKLVSRISGYIEMDEEVRHPFIVGFGYDSENRVTAFADTEDLMDATVGYGNNKIIQELNGAISTFSLDGSGRVTACHMTEPPTGIEGSLSCRYESDRTIFNGTSAVGNFHLTAEYDNNGNVVRIGDNDVTYYDHVNPLNLSVLDPVNLAGNLSTYMYPIFSRFPGLISRDLVKSIGNMTFSYKFDEEGYPLEVYRDGELMAGFEYIER